MLGQFSYRGGKDLDTGQKTVSPLRAFPFSFFFSPLFFFFFFLPRGFARTADSVISFSFSGQIIGPDSPSAALCPKPRYYNPPSFLYPPTRRRSSPSCLFELRFHVSLLSFVTPRLVGSIIFCEKWRDGDPSFSQKGMKNLWNEARQGRGVYWPSCSV